jgi:ABC-type nitrate/sulfonate/bicarbonate transport system permease component
MKIHDRVLSAELAPVKRARRRLLPSDAALEHQLSVLSPVVLVGVWEACARLGLIDTRFFPAPSSILQVLWQMLQPTAQFPAGEVWAHVSISIKRIAIGLALGVAPGVLIGFAVGLFRPVRVVVQPLVDATFPIPKLALLPLFMLVFGLGEESKYAIIASAVIYLVLINTAAGVHTIERVYFDVGKTSTPIES